VSGGDGGQMRVLVTGRRWLRWIARAFHLIEGDVCDIEKRLPALYTVL